MKPNTYLIIGKKGDKANIRDLHSFKHPDAKIYVLNLDYPILVSFVGLVTSKFVSQKTIPAATKAKFVSALTADALESMAKSGFTSVEKLQKVAGLVMEISKTSSEFDEEIIKILDSMPNDEAKHAMSTALVGVLIAEEMKITQAVVMGKIVMGSLLHDVGMRHLPPGLADKPMHLMTPDELQTYEQHPIRGAEVLRDVKDISMDVLLIVAEHHENAFGLGYPKKQRDVEDRFHSQKLWVWQM